MSIQRKIRNGKKRRAFHVRNRLRKDSTYARISVFRSARFMSAQIIDDVQQKTLVSFSSSKLVDQKGSKIEIAKIVGQKLAQLALEKGIKHVSFDRGRFLYHGRVKALAEGAREAGLQF